MILDTAYANFINLFTDKLNQVCSIGKHKTAEFDYENYIKRISYIF